MLGATEKLQTPANTVLLLLNTLPFSLSSMQLKMLHSRTFNSKFSMLSSAYVWGKNPNQPSW